jgi:hypothetical protein
VSKEHRDEHFSEFRGHTLLKHGVLDRYVKAWIQILGPHHETLWIVDGFAGKGQDDQGSPGSPLLLARSAAQLQGAPRAKNRRATIKIKEAVHSAVSKSPLPKSSKERIRLAHAVPMSRIVELVLERFAGQDVRWTDDAKSQDTVQGYALAETPMMNDQAPELREELTRAYLLEKKPLRLRFPSSGGR